jgi:NADPH2:quinone reductase
MRAVVTAGSGGREVLSWGTVPDLPDPGPGEVVLDVVATAVNRADILQRMGFYPPPPGESDIIGMECSGVVAAVGPGVSAWKTGDEACALVAGGAYAEQVRVPAGQLLPVPDGVSLVDAAALPEVTCTVWSNVLDRARLQPGEWFLVHGGSSGIGTAAIQIAHNVAGAHVAVTAGTEEKLERCRELGATLLVNYRAEDFVDKLRGVGGADVILDNMGAKYLERNVNALADGGRLVVIGMQGGVKAELNIATLLTKRGSVHATSLRSRTAADKARIVAGTVRDIWPAVADGRVLPIVDRVLPIAEVADAHRVVEDSEHVGKVVLAVRAGSGS